MLDIYKGLNTIGVDEAGRGALAGPVVAAAVYINKRCSKYIEDVNDSKKISHKKRETLFLQITKEHLFSVAVVDSKHIDKTNILKASLLAMERAVKKLNQKVDCVMVDGIFKIPNINLIQKTEIKGDQRIYSIAAASIIAKVTRDKIMQELSNKYSQYSFDKHKGYGTKKHKEEIKRHGIMEEHRKTFKLL